MTDPLPRVEVALATYNCADHIDEQISSILSQSYKAVDLIIRDDASTDATPQKLIAWAEKHPDRITILPGQKNLGVIANFDTILQQTTAPYVALSDCDDVWMPHKIELTLNRIISLEGKLKKDVPILAHTDLTVVDDDLNPIHTSYWRYSGIDPFNNRSLNRLLAYNNVTGCTVMVNRPLLDAALPLPHDCVMHDQWLALTAAAIGIIEVVNQPTILYRQHASNHTGAQKYSLRGLLKRAQSSQSRSRIRSNAAKRVSQTQALRDRYQAIMPQDKYRVVEAYHDFLTSNILKRTYLMQKHHFIAPGALRNTFKLVAG